VCSANGQKTLTEQFSELIKMHQEVLGLLMAVVEQNSQLLQVNSEMVSMLAPLMDDIEGEPTHYMDGTPIKRGTQ